MPVQIVTVDDLRELKKDLMVEFKNLLKEIMKENNGQQQQGRKWIKSYEVKKLLNISSGTLQHLRLTGILPFTRMGGALYYDNDDIQKILNENKKKI